MLLAKVQEVYNKALENGDTEAFQQLQALVRSGHSGVACLALAKVGWVGIPKHRRRCPVTTRRPMLGKKRPLQAACSQRCGI